MARRTLSFYPISFNLTPQDTHPNTRKICLERALNHFLQSSLAIPTSVASKLTCLDISYLPEKSEITAVFATHEHVKNIFKHVKNLSPGEKISPCIPPVLYSRYKQLRHEAYNLRNGSIPHKTVIRYQGNSLALYAKPTQSQTWQQVVEPRVEPNPPSLGAEYTPVNSNKKNLDNPRPPAPNQPLGNC